MAGTVSNNQIFNELKDVAVTVAKIDGRILRIEESNAELMKVVIKGNGRLPLTERVQALENRHSTEDTAKKKADETTEKKKEKWSTRTWAIVSAIIVYLLIQSIALLNIFERIAAIK